MKKIITASLVAMMAVSAANAEIASVEYVSGKTGDITTLKTDDKSNLTAAINELALKAGDESVESVKTSLESQIGGVDDKADANTQAIQDINNGTVMKSGITAEKVLAYDAYAAQIDGKQEALGYTAENVANKASKIVEGMDKDATYPTVALLEEQIAATNNDLAYSIEDVEGELADLAGVVNNNAAAASQAAAAAESAAKSYADGLKSTIDAAYAAADATTLQSAKDYADGKASAAQSAAEKTASDALAAAKTELEDKITASEYNDAEVRGLISDNADEISTIKGEQTTQNNAIKSLEDSLKEGGATADAIADAKKAGTDASAALETYQSSNDAALAGVKATAEQGVADAATAQAAANAAQATADTAVQREQVGMTEQFAITAECKAEGAVCSLVVREGKASWEKIAY